MPLPSNLISVRVRAPDGSALQNWLYLNSLTFFSIIDSLRFGLETAINNLTEKQLQQYESQDYLRLGKVMTAEALVTRQQRMDDIMLGTAPLDYDRMLMQSDREPGNATMEPQTKGHEGATLSYRNIEDLEYDPLFLAFMRKPLL